MLSLAVLHGHQHPAGARAPPGAATTLLPIFASEVERQRHPADVLDQLDQGIARPYGLRAYGIWHMPRDAEKSQSWKLGKNYFVHRSVPEAYWHEFWAQVAVHGPSILARMVAVNGGPFTWTEAARELKPTGTERWVFDTMCKHGLRDGFHCPVGRWIVSYWSGKVLKLDLSARSVLYAAAVFGAMKVEELASPRSKRSRFHAAPALTPRELAVLRNYAFGKDAHEIASTLNIGEGSVKTFFTRMQKKLGAKHRGHAVLLAVREHLLT